MAMHRVLDAGTERGDEGQRQDQLREGEEDVGDAHQDRIDPASGVAGDRADDQADRGRDDGDQDDDVERQPRAVDDAGEDVAPQVVGAEPDASALGGSSRDRPGRR